MNGKFGVVATDSKKNDRSAQKANTPFSFLDDLSPDLVDVVHAVILSSLPPADKNLICHTVAKNSIPFLKKYTEWRRLSIKRPPPGCLNGLPKEIQKAALKHLDYFDHDKIQKICEEHPEKTAELKDWLDKYRDREAYLSLVFDRARAILLQFQKDGSRDPICGNLPLAKTSINGPELKMVPSEKKPPVPAPRTNSLSPVPPKTLSFLLIGETGVGKTTFVNSFVNYLEHRFDGIMSQEARPLILVDTAFSVFNDENHTWRKVEVVADKEYRLDGGPNEVLTNGQSSTQEPVTYRYEWKDKTQQLKIIRIIDTPGVNDTRGAEQDDKNFDLILRHVRKIGGIDAVCILMKPNQTKISQPFRYCLNNLLLRLHRTVTKNVIFCFTHCRSTMFKPEESVNTIHQFLGQLKNQKGVEIAADRTNMFCFDNDCFRYLLDTKDFPRPRNQNEFNFFSESWEHNTAEIRKLLHKIDNVPENQDAKEVRKTRKLIKKLAPALADIVLELEQKRKPLEDHLGKLNKLGKGENKELDERERSKVEKLKNIENESPILLEACVELSVFLGHHSLTPEEDPFEMALTTLIQKEEILLTEQQSSNKKNKGPNSLLCYTLAAIMCEHIDKVKQAMEKISNNSGIALTVDEVNILIKNLTKLRYSGKAIGACLTTMEV